MRGVPPYHCKTDVWITKGVSLLEEIFRTLKRKKKEIIPSLVERCVPCEKFSIIY